MPAVTLLNAVAQPEIDTFFDLHFNHVVSNIVSFLDVDRATFYAAERVGQQGGYLVAPYRGRSLPLTFIGTTISVEGFSKHYTPFLNGRSAPHAEHINPRLPVVSVKQRFTRNGAASRPEVIYNYLTQGDLRRTRGFTPFPPSSAAS